MLFKIFFVVVRCKKIFPFKEMKIGLEMRKKENKKGLKEMREREREIINKIYQEKSFSALYASYISILIPIQSYPYRLQSLVFSYILMA